MNIEKAQIVSIILIILGNIWVIMGAYKSSTWEEKDWHIIRKNTLPGIIMALIGCGIMGACLINEMNGYGAL